MSDEGGANGILQKIAEFATVCGEWATSLSSKLPCYTLIYASLVYGLHESVLGMFASGDGAGFFLVVVSLFFILCVLADHDRMQDQ